MKKAFCTFILAFALLRLFCVGAGAAGEPCLRISAPSRAEIGTEFTVAVLLENNPGLISLRFQIVYDESILELVRVSDRGLLNGYIAPAPTVSSPYTMKWTDAFASSGNTANGCFVEITFRTKAGCESSTVSVNPVEIRDADGKKVSFEGSSASVTVETKEEQGSSLEYYPSVTPTCTEEGSVAFYLDRNSGMMYADPEGVTVISDPVLPIDPSNHQSVAEVSAIPASCVSEGKTAGSVCTACGETVSGCITLPKNGEHTFGEWQNNGDSHFRTCTLCGESETRFHSWDGGTGISETETLFACTLCGAERVETEIPAEEPTEEEPTVIPAEKPEPEVQEKSEPEPHGNVSDRTEEHTIPESEQKSDTEKDVVRPKEEIPENPPEKEPDVSKQEPEEEMSDNPVSTPEPEKDGESPEQSEPSESVTEPSADLPEVNTEKEDVGTPASEPLSGEEKTTESESESSDSSRTGIPPWGYAAIAVSVIAVFSAGFIIGKKKK